MILQVLVHTLAEAHPQERAQDVEHTLASERGAGRKQARAVGRKQARGVGRKQVQPRGAGRKQAQPRGAGRKQAQPRDAGRKQVQDVEYRRVPGWERTPAQESV
jgi:hypothetical protein